MGKSPGKWIKTVLFGKKTSKSSFSKNAVIERKESTDVKAPGLLAVDPPIVDLPPQTTYNDGENTELERGGNSLNLCNTVLLSGQQGSDTEASMGLNLVSNGEQEQAVIKAQAAFRGYLARRAFRALKGIIRLQALIRGHLVRRQAVATLRSMQAIVKFQAVIRGRQVRLSEAGCDVLKMYRSGESKERKQLLDPVVANTFLRSEKLSRNSFVIKLVASWRTVMPLRLQYDPIDPNSVRNWQERWSLSRFWEPIPRPKRNLNSKHQKKQANMQAIERESGRFKRGVQKVPALNSDGNSLHSSEFEKSRRTHRKALSHQTESVQEPQNELERVKRNLRKVSLAAEEALEKSEAATDKLQRSLKKASSSPISDVPEQGVDNSAEKMNSPVAVSEQPVVETPPKPLEVDEPVEKLHEDHPAVELLHSEVGEKVLNSENMNEELSPKEDQSKENHSTRRRSLPRKQEYSENVSQNTPTLPSYMAATESAKAKLRAQGSPRLGQDGAESGFVRRHSLPSSTNGKLSSVSPRVQRSAVQANGKGGSRYDRSLLSSRDEKVFQPGWRR
ncbi:protein IQ-DOMAIN 31-like [Diospyros lotus]|uniref:protein IQ-DOMAIN 31-like n=1 Tax=Diospyros lotus TaxID=55363 RepID=UPI00224E83FE|nr:protein IQ-DOMAIN 31-like [Diospyros lotus]XP_052189762.1 protein IQ-DOMAIN 31-like [Diospyros lotus]XP_052189763.1 protein IQ-DOMAIN 31-like [Diospyros lotus]